MQNIDVMFILQPLIVIAICCGLIVYWHFKRSFRIIVLVYSLIAYALAIALKYVVQIPTAATVINYFGVISIGTGVYFGLQTMIFEVGLAYLVAYLAVRYGKMVKKDAEAYGLGLGFWENAVLLGLLPLINLVSYYFILSGNSPIAQTLYNQLSQNAPGLFAPPLEALGTVVLGVVERTSSIIFHFAWGYLCMVAAVLRKRKLFLLALPMGLIDFLVPFASSMPIVIFEAVIFSLSLVSLLVAWYATKQFRKKEPDEDNKNTGK